MREFCTRQIPRAISALAVAMGCSLAPSARAADWVSPANGSWTDTANWTGADVPDTIAESAAINTAGAPYNVTLSTPLTIQSLTLDSADATLMLDSDLQIGTSSNAGTLTFNAGTIAGNATIYTGPLKIGPAGAGNPTGGHLTLISNAAANIQATTSGGGNILSGMTVSVRPLQGLSQLVVNVPSVFANHGTFNIHTPEDYLFTQVQAATSITNHGHLETFANTLGQGATFFSGSFTNAATGVAQFSTSVAFTGQVFNHGSMTVDATHYIQAINQFTQVAGTLSTTLTLDATNFDYQGGTISGPVRTNHLLIAPGVSTGAFTLRRHMNGHASIGPSGGMGGDIPAGVSVVSDSVVDNRITHLNVGNSFINEGSLHLRSINGDNITLVPASTGTFTNRGTYLVDSPDVTPGAHVISGYFVNDAAGDATFDIDSTIAQNATNDGAITLDRKRALNISSNFAQSATGDLNIELGGADFSQLFVTGDATLAGTLHLAHVDGFDPLTAPPEQQMLEILTASALSGDFDAVTGSYLGDGNFWKLIYDSNSLTLDLTQAAAGDADLDGDIDLSDLSALAANYGALTGADWLQGDFDHDGDVDLSDLSSLAANYGTGEAQAIADFQLIASVPEPALLGIVGFFAFLRRR